MYSLFSLAKIKDEPLEKKQTIETPFQFQTEKMPRTLSPESE
jgi:hypothetical protein